LVVLEDGLADDTPRARDGHPRSNCTDISDNNDGDYNQDDDGDEEFQYDDDSEEDDDYDPSTPKTNTNNNNNIKNEIETNKEEIKIN